MALYSISLSLQPINEYSTIFQHKFAKSLFMLKLEMNDNNKKL